MIKDDKIKTLFLGRVQEALLSYASGTTGLEDSKTMIFKAFEEAVDELAKAEEGVTLGHTDLGDPEVVFKRAVEKGKKIIEIIKE